MLELNGVKEANGLKSVCGIPFLLNFDVQPLNIGTEFDDSRHVS